MSVGRVAVSFPVKPEIRAVYENALGEEVVFLSDLDGPVRDRALGSAEVLVSQRIPGDVTGPELSGMEGLRFIQFTFAGVDAVRFAELPPTVMVAGNVGAYAEPIAEHVIAMVLALAKRLLPKHSQLARGEFIQRPRSRWVRGSVVACLGFGGIGKATAARFRVLGAKVVALNTTGRTHVPVEFVGTLDDLNRILPHADIVVVALPLTKATRGLIGRHELALMKPDAILVNVARGPIVQSEALYEHLRDHPEFMAGIDAWWDEPWDDPGGFRPPFPFFELPNFLGSPHNSAFVAGFEVEAARHAVENVRRYLRGETPAGVVRREDYVD